MIEPAIWRSLYEESCVSGTKLSGIYHDNYVVQHDGVRYVLRLPRPMPPSYDVEPRMFGEAAILEALPFGLPVPRLVHQSDEPDFLVTSWCPGERLDTIRPPDTPAPASLASTVATVFTRLYDMDPADLGEPLPVSPWAATAIDGDFFGGLLSWLDRIYQGADAAEQAFLSAVGLPDQPFSPALHVIRGDDRRPRLCHGDLQRTNILARGDELSLIDWELAIWADPLWDVASHVHRAGFPPEQEKQVLSALLATIPEWTDGETGWEDYQVYLRVERFRSLVLDALRHLRGGPEWNETQRRSAVQEYHRKLTTAGLDMDFARLWSLHAEFW
ncbi:phosphotransferase [Actinoplanes sp. NPDC026619]|uniref:phosphotransferase family protein n=1 Tax=Actinoplanes sp. NPDC026619 TaxID=3155798 RepID=UPI0033D3F656